MARFRLLVLLIGMAPLLSGCIVVQVVLGLICVIGLENAGVDSRTAGRACSVFFQSPEESQQCLRDAIDCAQDPSPFSLSCIEARQPNCISIGGPPPSGEGLEPSTLSAQALATAVTYDAPQNFTLIPGTDAAGQPTSVLASFEIPAGQLQTHREVLTLPPAFSFNGFTAVGPANTQIGTYEIEVPLVAGPLVVQVPIRALSADTAYLDGDNNGVVNANFDSLIEHSIDATGSHLFTIVTPFGGDGIRAFIEELFSAQVRASLGEGILTNPTAPGSYTFRGDFTSVDLDTGGADDGIGESPRTAFVETPVNITGAIDIAIDIKPGELPNAINPKSKGVVPVAILTTDTFDAATVDPLSVRFGPNGAIEAHGRGHIEDVDGDGDNDMVLHFRTQDTGSKCSNTSASLTGKTTSGQDIKGSDSIRTVGC